MSAKIKRSSRPQVYIAAPLFSPTERQINKDICSALESLCVVYLPQRDGILMEAAINDDSTMAGALVNEIYHGDALAIRRCEALVAVLDGRVPDEGVCIEIGYAKALGKVIVGYKSDVRVALPWGHNPILVGCIDFWVSSKSELVEWVTSFATRKSCGE